MKRKKPRESKEFVPKDEQDYSESSLEEVLKTLTNKQKMFCKYYVRNWNATRAAIRGGYSAKSAGQMGCDLLKKPNIQRYIALIQQDIASEIGTSKIDLLEELLVIAKSDIKDIRDGWIELKDWEMLIEQNPNITKAIQEVDTKTETKIDQYKNPIEVQYVRIKLHDKRGAIQDIFKAMGWNEPEKTTLTLEQPLFPDIK